MSRIVLGDNSGHPVHLDIERLIATRLLIQANSGAGKSWLLRRMGEELFGKIQVIFLDPEGEFSTLREKYGYVLAGKGGETAADPRTAALLAHRLLDLRASAICDIYEMKAHLRHEFVHNFLEAMVDAPKNLWHPVVVILDEAHVYCPEKGAGESVAAESVIGMATRGRKRGYALVLATQRLGKLRKDATAELLNICIGGTFQDIDRKRAADALGVYGKDVHPFYDKIKLLKPGSFYCLGPAISKEAVIIQSGPISTTHPEAGSRAATVLTPAPADIQRFLPSLSDLPAEQEKKAATEKELRDEIRALRVDNKRLKEQNVVVAPVIERIGASKINEAVRREITEAMGPVRKAMVGNHRELLRTKDFFENLGKRLQVILNSIDEFSKVLDISEIPKLEVDADKIREGFTPRKEVTTVAPANFEKIVGKNSGPPKEYNGDPLSGPEVRILEALSELHSVGIICPSTEQVAAWASYSPGSGGFNNPKSALHQKGLISYPRPGELLITDAGLSIAGRKDAPDAQTVKVRILDNLDGPMRKILHALIEFDRTASVEEVATRAGYAVGSGGFNNPKSALRTRGLIDYPAPGQIQLAPWLIRALE